MKPCVIFDIDGTLADVEHRQVWVRDGKKRWDKFNALMAEDAPKQDIIKLNHILYAAGQTIILCSGREEIHRDVTEKWLKDNDVKYHDLFMRRKMDFRKDSIVKKELLMDIRAIGFEPWIVFDDRNQVVDMWREEGLTCCQVAEGNF